MSKIRVLWNVIFVPKGTIYTNVLVTESQVDKTHLHVGLKGTGMFSSSKWHVSPLLLNGSVTPSLLSGI